MLVRETYPDVDVAALLEKHFIAVKVNAGKDAGRALAGRYEVRAYPTLLITDPKGEEVDRLIGFRPPAKIIPELKGIIGGSSFAALKKRVAADGSDLEAVLELAAKHQERGAYEKAEELYRKVIDAAGAPAELRRQAEGRLSLAVYLKSRGRDASALEAYFEKSKDGPDGLEQARILLGHHHRAKDDGKLARVAEYLLRHGRDRADAGSLNAVAWDLATKDEKPKLSLELARKAAELAPEDAAILDTLAVACSKNGLHKEALETQRKAVRLAPEQIRKELEGRLEEFEKAAEEHGGKRTVRL
ncbi:MAG: hypothetical protein HY721_19480 [Planctomycetes bacterium]|nr:hypothetical protein [Planctomycetota bacterium]